MPQEIISEEELAPENLRELANYKDQEATTLPVIEIFGPTIQGEGSMIGVRTMFIRFGGCDYRCQKCDSLHAVIPQAVKTNSRWMTPVNIVTEVLEKALQSNTKWVTISGGNPLMWDMYHLVQLFKKFDIKVAVETQGSIWRDWALDVDMLTISPKTPGMGERFIPQVFESFLSKIENGYQRLTGSLAVCIKLVIFDQNDLEMAVAVDQILEARNLAVKRSFWPRDDRYLSLGNPYPPRLPKGETTLVTEDHGMNLPMVLLDQYRNLLEYDFLNDSRLTYWKFLPQLHTLIWSNKGEV